MRHRSSPRSARRDDPALDTRRLVVFFAGLVITYLGVIAVARPDWSQGEDALKPIAVGIMFAPTVGALAAVLLAHGRIVLGRPSWWLLGAFVPVLVVFVATLVVGALGGVDLHLGNALPALLLTPVFAVIGSLTAVGEELGWRGFLWPLLRRRSTFWVSSAFLFVVWWAYHAPLVFLGVYGSLGGLPAFTVAVAGFVLFVGVLTDRSASVWPSVLTHGAWNAMVIKHFSATGSEGSHETFTGSSSLLGEFGWIAALCMLACGLAASWWHLQHPMTTPDTAATAATATAEA
jgi:membrane protease YdiL (CAAX protease family)